MTLLRAKRAAIVLDPKLVDRGRGRYEALDCATCHGENAEGVDGNKSLLDFALSEDDFITFMRSGGELGVQVINSPPTA